MKDFAIISTRDLDRAAQRLQDLKRYAERRDELLESLDLDRLGCDQLSRICAEDEQINEDLAGGHLYINHLAGMEALGSSIRTDLRLTAQRLVSTKRIRRQDFAMAAHPAILPS